LNQRPSGYEAAPSSGSSPVVEGNSTDSKAAEQPAIEARGHSTDPTVTLSHATVERAIEAALAGWKQRGDRTSLRRALIDLLRELELGS
jgi:hypothetical protein